MVLSDSDIKMQTPSAPFTSRTFSKTDLDRALRLAVKASHAVADTLKANFGQAAYDIKEDNARNWVTKWDTWAEERIKTILAPFSDEIGFCGEESEVRSHSDIYWTIDPIDAASHYVRGNDYCTTMIALVDHEVPVVAVIHDFIRGDTYTAIAGQGAYKNTQAVHVSNRPLMTAYLDIHTRDTMPENQQLRKAIEQTRAYFLTIAAAGFTFLSVARGTTEGFIAINNPYGTEWDIAPGALLVHEAGGIVRNIGSEGFSCKNFDFIAANPVVFEELAAIIH